MIGHAPPQAVTTYVDEIKKVTNQPIKYVIYSHSHYDHIAGGKPFKDLGATFIAHKNAKAQLEKFPSPDVVMPDEPVDNERTLNLGGTTLELLYVGRNHSDNSLCCSATCPTPRRHRSGRRRCSASLRSTGIA